MAYLRDGGQPTQLMVLRCLCNLFFNSASVYIMLGKRSMVIENIAHLGQSDNKNIRQAVFTIFLNYSVLYLDKNDPEGRIQIISALSEVWNKETDE